MKLRVIDGRADVAGKIYEPDSSQFEITNETTIQTNNQTGSVLQFEDESILRLDKNTTIKVQAGSQGQAAGNSFCSPPRAGVARGGAAPTAPVSQEDEAARRRACFTWHNDFSSLLCGPQAL